MTVPDFFKATAFPWFITSMLTSLLAVILTFVTRFGGLDWQCATDTSSNELCYEIDAPAYVNNPIKGDDFKACGSLLIATAVFGIIGLMYDAFNGTSDNAIKFERFFDLLVRILCVLLSTAAWAHFVVTSTPNDDEQAALDMFNTKLSYKTGFILTIVAWLLYMPALFRSLFNLLFFSEQTPRAFLDVPI
tara:strand:- start:239 stop:808 length:570 start_codon:yes stop_codon:yes gene_type:complete